ncbi:subclass B1 metallo-beta-lactamase [Agriterribacter sp.]|uniref:subclass B1 metallo-beta-lactamase n=1 Tax=Agriterribacter sp. TaxID=2821509 RepID=UPI002BDC985A|nr:subclass B1 metallo-beta-lactamase [Agriterribacter sp.]HTN08405.1 subclass B1 metallo-beta-lactamase [Agriterribacter sp.]
MKKLLTIFLPVVILLISCESPTSKQDQPGKTNVVKTGASLNDSSIVYKTDNLIITRLSNHTYAHTSFLNTNDFGRVPCNGMVVVNANEAIIFDTPSDDESSGELINFLMNNLQCKIKAIIPTHFHEDCVGGLEKFNEYNIPAYASNTTIELLKIKGRKFSKPIKGFADSLALNIGDKKVYAQYFGEGHTKDNIIGYYPDDNVLFGGCLIKESGATKGNLEDAYTKEWPITVHKLRQQYPDTKIVIPGHGKWGGTELFDYTIKLFE